MKRQRQTDQPDDAVPTRELTLADFRQWILQNDETLSCDEIMAIKQEIGVLYPQKANIIVQSVPSTWWLRFFRYLAETGIAPLSYGREKIAGFDLRIFFSFRLVSKLWHSLLQEVDISPLLPSLVSGDITKFKGLNLPKMFSLLPFSRLHHQTRQHGDPPLDLSWLTKILDLRLDQGSIHPERGMEISQLTQLTSLDLIGPTIPEQALHCLTNLQILGVRATTQLTHLDPLTKLHTLALLKMPLEDSLTQPHLLQALPHLTRLMADKPEFFRSGKGKCLYSDPSRTYDGQWKEGKHHGQGTFLDEKKNIYAGDWHEGQMHGKGTFGYFFRSTGRISSTYDGDWVHGVRHGRGSRVYSTQESYEGEWVDGKKTRGVYKFQEGQVYEGQFRDNQINGQGHCIDPNRNHEYKGEFEDGYRHGTGV